jgi:hypothetical protein
MKVMYIDPPEGWKYGFPKVLPKGVDDVRLWLVRNGYPIKLMESWGEHFYCRMWYSETEDE